PGNRWREAGPSSAQREILRAVGKPGSSKEAKMAIKPDTTCTETTCTETRSRSTRSARRRRGLHRLAVRLRGARRRRCRPPPGRELGHLTEACLLARCVRLRLHPNHDRATRALIVALRTCAQRAQAHDDLQLPGREISTLVDELAPGLRVEPGVGPVGAAQLLIAG